jgi:hypothetical protein
MDLDLAKSVDAKTLLWARIGMLVCFVVSAGILIISLAAPTPARAAHPGVGHTPIPTSLASLPARLPTVAPLPTP